MPVMKRLTVDGVNYDTVGEASVTQVQTSGTKIATVTIDGTATDLYAPEGGGGGGGMLVTFTTPDGGGTYTADKTFGEIFAAFDSGIQPVFKFVSSSTATTYTTIRDVSTSISSTPYRIVFSSFYTTAIYGAANDYPSWESDGNN